MRIDLRMRDNLVAISEEELFFSFVFFDQTSQLQFPDGSGYEIFVYARKMGKGFYCRIRPAGLIMGIG